jgi:hypothetical protein
MYPFNEDFSDDVYSDNLGRLFFTDGCILFSSTS